MSRRSLGVAVCAVVSAVTLLGSQDAAKNLNKEQARLAEAGVVITEVLNVPDNVPQEILDRAECVVVIPSMTKVALGIGGSYGRGALVCRGGAAFTGPWGAPAMFAIEAGSVGFQLGADSTDVVLMVMNARGAQALLGGSQVKLGAGASIAAGPKGRRLEAATDAAMRAEFLSYSRTRGLFAGISLEGSSLRPDDDASAEVYGHRMSARDIVTGTMAVPAAGRALVDMLQKRSPKNMSE